MDIIRKDSKDYDYAPGRFGQVGVYKHPDPDKINIELRDASTINVDQWREQEAWAKEHLHGEYCLWAPGYYFELEEDLMLFILRWCG